jgi:hypothetical protein
MKIKNRRTRLVVVLLILAFSLGVSTPAHGQVKSRELDTQPSPEDPQWHFNVSPYLWLLGVDGTVGLAGHEAKVQQSFGDVFSHLKFGAMGLTEVRRKRLGVLLDLLYARVGGQQAVPVAGIPSAVNVKITESTFTLNPDIAYRLYQNDRVSIDALGGIRYRHLGIRIALNPDPIGGSPFSGSNDWADGVGGGRFQVKLTPRIGAFFVGDAGAGGSDLTWQLVTGLGYEVGKRTTLNLGYRHEYVDRHGVNNFLFNMTQHGLILGTTFQITKPAPSM